MNKIWITLIVVVVVAGITAIVSYQVGAKNTKKKLALQLNGGAEEEEEVV